MLLDFHDDSLKCFCCVDIDIIYKLIIYYLDKYLGFRNVFFLFKMKINIQNNKFDCNLRD